MITCLRFSRRHLYPRIRKLSTTNPLTALPRKTSSSVEHKLLEKDNIPEDYSLIYRAPMEGYVISINTVSTATSVFVALLAAFKYSQKAVMVVPEEMSIIGLVAHDADFWIFLVGFVAINAFARLFVFNFPLRVYRNNDKYIATYWSQLLWGTNKHFFNQGEVYQVISYINPWSNITYRLGTRTSLLLLDYFRTPSEFQEMTKKPTD